LILLDAENGQTPTLVNAILDRAVANHMVVWVSMITFSTNIGTAFGGGQFYSLQPPSGFICSNILPNGCYLAMWSRQWMKDLANKYKANIIIDAMQEFIGTSDRSTETGRQEWRDAAKANIQFFRSEGYTNPLEIMGNFQGRDLYAIYEYGSLIAAVDTVTVNGQPQTMFGWQAYWGTSDGWYPSFFGNLFLGGTSKLSGAQAITQFAANEPFPIEIGIDNYPGDTNHDYQAEIDAAASVNMTWLWWSWNGSSGWVECPADGATCQQYVVYAPNGFAGAHPLSAP